MERKCTYIKVNANNSRKVTINGSIKCMPCSIRDVNDQLPVFGVLKSENFQLRKKQKNVVHLLWDLIYISYLALPR